ncbi:hypothetical protein I7I51_00993, partial [Histoplasma capsulatum]
AESPQENLRALTMLDPTTLRKTLCRVQLLLPPSIQIDHEPEDNLVDIDQNLQLPDATPLQTFSSQGPPDDPSAMTLDCENTGPPGGDIPGWETDLAEREKSMNNTCPSARRAGSFDPLQGLLDKGSDEGRETVLPPLAGPASDAALVDDADNPVDWQSWINDDFLVGPPNVDSETCVDTEGVRSSQGCSPQSSAATGPATDRSVSVDPSGKACTDMADSDLMVHDPGDDIGSDPCPTVSYPTPVSNPSNTPRPASRVVKRRHIMSSGKSIGRRGGKWLESTQKGCPVSPSSVFTADRTGGSHGSRYPTLESMFPELSHADLNVVRRKGDRLLHCNLPEFLATQSTIWRMKGFWDQPAVTLRVSQTAPRKDNYAKVFRYVEAMGKQEEANFMRIRLGRTLLYLLYIEELEETESRRGSGIREPGKVKTEAINSLLEGIYASEGQGAPIDEKKRQKIRKTFHQKKRFGPGALLACSEQTGMKVNNPKFPLDALVAYLLHGRAGDVALCHQFDHAARCLLMKGEFRCEFTRGEIQAWIDRSTEPDHAAAHVPRWRKFEPRAAAEVAQAFLREWKEGKSGELVDRAGVDHCALDDEC